MSRSYRHSPYCSVTCNGFDHGEKRDKRHANRRLRLIVKSLLRKGAEVFPQMREISEVWDFAKDGRMFVGDVSEWSKPWQALGK